MGQQFITKIGYHMVGIYLDVGLLQRLSDAFGPPGAEEEPREVLRAGLEGVAD